MQLHLQIICKLLNLQSQMLLYLPVLYMWFGGQMPEDYAIYLGTRDYPLTFVSNPVMPRTFSRELLNAEKADYYKLWAMYEYGGFYSDFDNEIDYKCLQRTLDRQITQDLVVMKDVCEIDSKKIALNFFYAPRPKSPLIKRMLDNIDEGKGQIWDFVGNYYYWQYRDELLSLNLSECIKHTGDWSWWKDSNTVLKADRTNLKYEQKKHTKKQIKEELARIQQKLNTQAVESLAAKAQFEKKLEEASAKLRQQTEKCALEEAKKQEQIKLVQSLNLEIKQCSAKVSQKTAALESEMLKLKEESQQQKKSIEAKYQQITKEAEKYKTEAQKFLTDSVQKKELQKQVEKLKQNFVYCEVLEEIKKQLSKEVEKLKIETKESSKLNEQNLKEAQEKAQIARAQVTKYQFGFLGTVIFFSALTIYLLLPSKKDWEMSIHNSDTDIEAP